ncbi:hypothetical protein [Acerihabitans arboris]|uniref:Uncharacterized protein n=1 Tax=Acerihabitans arboris TaxID=2691583 RepID=A0A845SMU5_9GAMM|nr:hypothetical protein [Acerihabitans arboris]NDL64537.1 hypothetical protein [Acerihabitans arboris]
MNISETVCGLAPQLATLAQGAMVGCAVIGLGSSPLAGFLAGAGAAFTIAATVTGSMTILAQVHD